MSNYHIKSKQLHLKLGFKQVGTYHNVGFKNGKWLDVEVYEKKIGSYDVQPLNILSVSELPVQKLEEIFNNCSSYKTLLIHDRFALF